MDVVVVVVFILWLWFVYCIGFILDMVKRDLVLEVIEFLWGVDWCWERGLGVLVLVIKYIFIVFIGWIGWFVFFVSMVWLIWNELVLKKKILFEWICGLVGLMMGGSVYCLGRDVFWKKILSCRLIC